MPGPGYPKIISGKRIRKPVQKYDPALPMPKKTSASPPRRKDDKPSESESPQDPSNVALPDDSLEGQTAMNISSAPETTETRRESEPDGVFGKTYNRFSTIVSVEETRTTDTEPANAVAGSSTSTPLSTSQSKGRSDTQSQPRFENWSQVTNHMRAESKNSSNRVEELMNGMRQYMQSINNAMLNVTKAIMEAQERMEAKLDSWNVESATTVQQSPWLDTYDLENPIGLDPPLIQHTQNTQSTRTESSGNPQQRTNPPKTSISWSRPLVRKTTFQPTNRELRSDREFDAIDTLEDDGNTSEDSNSVPVMNDVPIQTSIDPNAPVTFAQIMNLFERMTSRLENAIKGSSVSDTSRNDNRIPPRTPRPIGRQPIPVPTYNNQRLDIGTSITSTDEQSDSENNDDIQRPEQSDIPLSRREFMEDLNRSVAVRDLRGRPSFTISAKPARQVKKIFQTHKTLKPWDPSTDLRSPMQFLSEFFRKVIPYVMQPGDAVHAFLQHLAGDASDWALDQDQEAPFSEIIDAFQDEFYSPVEQNREDAMFNATDYPMFQGQRIYEFASYWIDRLRFNRAIPVKAKFEKLGAKLPPKYDDFLERAYLQLTNKLDPDENDWMKVKRGLRDIETKFQRRRPDYLFKPQRATKEDFDVALGKINYDELPKKYSHTASTSSGNSNSTFVKSKFKITSGNHGDSSNDRTAHIKRKIFNFKKKSVNVIDDADDTGYELDPLLYSDNDVMNIDNSSSSPTTSTDGSSGIEFYMYDHDSGELCLVDDSIFNVNPISPKKSSGNAEQLAVRTRPLAVETPQSTVSKQSPKQQLCQQPIKDLPPLIWHGYQVIGDSIAKRLSNQLPSQSDFTMCHSGHTIPKLYNEVKSVNQLASNKLFVYIGINDVLLDPMFDITIIGPKLEAIMKRFIQLGAEDIIICQLAPVLDRDNDTRFWKRLRELNDKIFFIARGNPKIRCLNLFYTFVARKPEFKDVRPFYYVLNEKITYVPKSQFYRKITPDGRVDKVHLNNEAYQSIERIFKSFVGIKAEPIKEKESSSTFTPTAIIKRPSNEVNLIDKYTFGDPIVGYPVFRTADLPPTSPERQVAVIESVPVDLNEALDQEVANIENGVNAFEEDIEREDHVQNIYKKYRDVDKPPLIMLSFGPINEVILMDTGAAFSFLGEALFQQIKERCPEAVSTVINLSGGQSGFTLAAGKGKIRPKQAAVITFKFTKVDPEVNKPVRMSVAIIPDLNRNALIGRNVLLNFKMKQDFEKLVHSLKYPGSDDEVFVPFESTLSHSKADINAVLDIVARIEFEPTKELLGEEFDYCVLDESTSLDSSRLDNFPNPSR